MNFTGYFEKLSEFMDQVNNYCPLLQGYRDIFNEFQRFRDAVDDFYAIVIVFCTEALKIVQGKGSFIFYIMSAPPSACSHGGVFLSIASTQQ